MTQDKRLTVLTIFGTRPEAIKLAPVVHQMQAKPGRFASKVCVTAQHREMLDRVLTDFSITPDFDLNLMRRNQALAGVAAAVLAEIPVVLDSVRPDIVLVQGDTTTTFSAALAAYLQRIPVGHVEAGLRTGDFDHPFPEEMNRCLTSRLSTLHFAPTEFARDALLREGIKEDAAIVTGNTVIDALFETLDSQHEFGNKDLALLDGSPIILVTTHRRESFGTPMRSICAAVERIAKSKFDHTIVIPVHPNPAVSSIVIKTLSKIDNVRLVDPLSYKDFVNLMARSRIILTDSGGVQEEAPSLNVPVLILRKTTERPEAVAAGANRLVGTDEDTIVAETLSLLDDGLAYSAMARADNPYGDGRAAERIVSLIEERL